MLNNLFISYDLKSPHQDYVATIDAIKSLGAWAAVQKSLWYVNTNITTAEAAKIVREKQDANDSLIVINTTNNEAHWYNISDEVASHIKAQWYQ